MFMKLLCISEPNFLKKVFKSYSRPSLEYAANVWSLLIIADTNLLVKDSESLLSGFVALTVLQIQ